ncbi:MAG: CDP-glucose 4,6-dehydratase [Gammaproteobacteria bacterium]|nr:CDP-glucose 4,6-dehydratase [Gammaproteobacteria bacterium]
MKLFNDIYKSRRILITGHTGFKGSWLTLWLKRLGADITGISLPATTYPNHWNLLDLSINEYIQDIRDSEAVNKIIKETQPEIIFHLAAQPLVRFSYAEPLLTWETNVMGTANILNASREIDNLKAIVAITTDKCYENKEWTWGYRENDQLGGYDPYSASKAATELLASSYRNSYYSNNRGPLLATARAGNVIGGGDWSQDRLIPDLIRAVAEKQTLIVRSPSATRPWQHVLESLAGYLMLGERLLNDEQNYAEAWNFGPDLSSNRSVYDVLEETNTHWNEFKWKVTQTPQPHEANLLYLDSTKAKSILGWNPVWGFQETIEKTASWYRKYLESGAVESDTQIEHYSLSLAKKLNS